MNPLEASRREPVVYAEPAPGGTPPKRLFAIGGPEAGRSFVFFDEIRIGRLKPSEQAVQGHLLVPDSTVSSRHCVITQDGAGRCFIRDLSLNGTWVDGRRLVPGAEEELKEGQEISIGKGRAFRLQGRPYGSVPPPTPSSEPRGQTATDAVAPRVEATVIVGDVQGYTDLVRSESPALIQNSVNALFQALEEVTIDCGGTVKEYPGDALLAYWEDGLSESSAVRGCRAALALDGAARRLARDPTVWMLPRHPLLMQWALATGSVRVQRLGKDRPLGLSMVGEPVIKAARLEKIADETTGPILTCAGTRELAAGRFRFTPLGERTLQGFPRPEPVYALVGPR